MPVYDVCAEEPDGTERRFEWKEATEVGKQIYDSMTSYVVIAIRPDESGRYDAIIEARSWMGPPEFPR
jgi:hypothetical protein